MNPDIKREWKEAYGMARKAARAAKKVIVWKTEKFQEIHFVGANPGVYQKFGSFLGDKVCAVMIERLHKTCPPPAYSDDDFVDD